MQKRRMKRSEWKEEKETRRPGCRIFRSVFPILCLVLYSFHGSFTVYLSYFSVYYLLLFITILFLFHRLSVSLIQCLFTLPYRWACFHCQSPPWSRITCTRVSLLHAGDDQPAKNERNGKGRERATKEKTKEPARKRG